MGKSKAKIYFFPNSLHKQKIKYHILQAYEIIAFSLYLFHGLKFPSSFYNHFPNIRMEKIKPYQNYSHFGKLIPEPITRNLTFFFKKYNGTCKFCNFTVRNKEFADSKENDLLLAGAVGEPKNIPSFIRSLRTTGSKCSCVLLIDDDMVIDPITLQTADECGMQIIRCGKYVDYPYGYASNGFIYFFIKAFLEQNVHKFDRVIIVDLYDTVFQGDPFNVQVQKTCINAIDENHDLLHNRINRDWTNHAGWPHLHALELGYRYLCSGYFGGSAEDILHLVQVYCQYADLSSGAPDQGVFNHLFIKKSKMYGLKRCPYRKIEFVFHTIGGKTHRLKGRRNLGNIPTRSDVNSYASVVHHVYSSKYLQASILWSCPRSSPSQPNYMGRMPEQYITKMEKNFPKDFIFESVDNKELGWFSWLYI